MFLKTTWRTTESSALSSLTPTCVRIWPQSFLGRTAPQKQSSAATCMNICVEPANVRGLQPSEPHKLCSRFHRQTVKQTESSFQTSSGGRSWRLAEASVSLAARRSGSLKQQKRKQIWTPPRNIKHYTKRPAHRSRQDEYLQRGSHWRELTLNQSVLASSYSYAASHSVSLFISSTVKNAHKALLYRGGVEPTTPSGHGGDPQSGRARLLGLCFRCVPQLTQASSNKQQWQQATSQHRLLILSFTARQAHTDAGCARRPHTASAPGTQHRDSRPATSPRCESKCL